jgi:hypothetical protein
MGVERRRRRSARRAAEHPLTGRYAPPEVVNSKRTGVWGIENLRTICTSHIERFNLSLRTFMKRFTRLSLGFSKKLTNLKAAVALHVFHYNFCRVHSSIRCTPAMRAKLTERIWTLGGFVRGSCVSDDPRDAVV